MSVGSTTLRVSLLSANLTRHLRCLLARQTSQQAGASRVSEATLHFLELFGGWPAAYLAQQRLRHKTIKRSYQMIYWSIVGFYQYLALEVLLQWRVLHGFLTLFR